MRCLLLLVLGVSLLAGPAVAADTAAYKDVPNESTAAQAALKVAEQAILNLNSEDSPFDIKTASLVKAQQDGENYKLTIEGKSVDASKSTWEALITGATVKSLGVVGDPNGALITNGKTIDGSSLLPLTSANATTALAAAAKAIYDFNPDASSFDIKNATLVDAKSTSSGLVKLQLAGVAGNGNVSVWEATVNGTNVVKVSAFNGTAFVPLIENGTLAGGYMALPVDDAKAKAAFALAQPAIENLNVDASPFDIKTSTLLAAKDQPNLVVLSIEGVSADGTRSNWEATVDVAKKEVVSLAAFGPADSGFVTIPKVDGKFVPGEFEAAAPGPVKAAAAPGPASGVVARGLATVGWVVVAVTLLG